MSDESVNSIQSLRIDYAVGQLDEDDVLSDPIEQFTQWFEQAKSAKVREPNAMTLATVDASSMPAARIVLLKGFDGRGFTFFTNYDSAKGVDLQTNPNAALLFFWEMMERQVRVQGTVQRVSASETAEYFATRPRSAQIGAWASNQSHPVTSRTELDEKVAELNRRFNGKEVPPPPYWGGYRLTPTVMEFWQGRPSRLHDRLQYRQGTDGRWKIQRLAP